MISWGWPRVTDCVRPAGAAWLFGEMATQQWSPLQNVLLTFSLMAVIATVVGIAIVTAPGLG